MLFSICTGVNMKNLIRKSIFTAVLMTILFLLGSVVSAQTGKTKTVRFQRGKNSAVLKGAVVRGTQDRYIVGAKNGQTITVKVTSIEKNANFTVYFSGEQESLKDSEEATNWTGKLPADNNYVIVVAPTRGNATYTLTITIK